MELSAAWCYPPRFVDADGVRIHYVEDGTGADVVFLHGNPTWSYLWRNVLPWVAPHARCVAVDLVGMGRSEQPTKDPTLLTHAHYLDAALDRLVRADVTLVLHDWGGALGLLWASRHPDRVRGVALVAADPLAAVLESVPTWDSLPETAATLFRRYRDPLLGWHLVGEHNVFVESTLRFGARRTLTDDEMAYYRAPFASLETRRVIQRWNQQVPIAGEPAENVPVIEAVQHYFRTAEVPKLLLYGHDPDQGEQASDENPWIAWCLANVVHAAAVAIGPAGHYAPEDQPDAIGRALAAWLATIP